MQKNIDSVYYNNSGYFDPTAGRALDKIVQEEELLAEMAKVPKKRRKRKQRRKRQRGLQGESCWY